MGPRQDLQGWIRAACDLTNGSAVCPAKALLGDQSDSGEAFDLYARYFDRFLFVDDAVCVPSLRAGRQDSGGQQLLKNLFRWGQPKEEPAFFSFFNRHDLIRLSLVTGNEIVVYYSDTRSPNIVVLHDSRCVNLARPDSTAAAVVQHYLLVSDGRLLRQAEFSETPATQLDRIYLSNPTNVYYSKDFGGVENCWLGGVERLLEKIGLPGFPVRENSDRPRIDEAAEFQGRRAALWSRWQTPVILCSLVGLSGRPPATFRLDKALKARKALSSFQTLTFVKSDDAVASDLLDRAGPPVPVICCFAGTAVGLLADPFASHVRQTLLGLGEERDRLSNGGVGSCLPPPGLGPRTSAADREAAYKLLKEKRRSSRSAKIDATEKRCRCAICSSREFDNNMSRAGPERLMAGRYCVRDLLHLLGLAHLLDERDFLEEASNICVASMDIESRTVDVDLGRGCEAEESSKGSGGRRPEEVRQVQRPIMLAHVDELTVSLDPSDPARFCSTAANDTDGAAFDLFAAYWDYVCFARRRAAVAKARLLRPLYEVVRAYQLAYWSFCRDWIDRDEARRNEKLQEARDRARQPPRKKRKVVASQQKPPASLEELAERNRQELRAPLDSFLLRSPEELSLIHI